MAVALDTSAIATGGANGANSATSTSFTTSAVNEVIYVLSDTSNDSATVSSISNTSGLTWVKIDSINKGASQGWVEVWRAFAASIISTQTVTVNYAGGFPQANIIVVPASGVDTTGTSGSGSVGATNKASANSTLPTTSVTTTRPGSLVIAAVGQDSNNSLTAGASQTKQTAKTTASALFSIINLLTQNANTSSSGTSVTMNGTFAGSAPWGIIAVEVLAPVSAVSGKVVSVKQAVNRASTY